MKYIVYLTKNLTHKPDALPKIYIGVHQTHDPYIFDNYIGNGVYITQPSTYMYAKTPFQKAVKKYGIKSFERTTLFIFDTAKEAYNKEMELVNIDFLKLPHTYNACLGGNVGTNYKALYQFDLKGNLKKKWQFSKEAYDFYGYPMEKFKNVLASKTIFLDSLWSTSETIDASMYSDQLKNNPVITHLYTKEGKWLGEFESRKACGEYLGLDGNTVVRAVNQQSLLDGEYYVSNSMTDEFVPKAKKSYQNATFYLYGGDKVLIGEYKGKELLPVINLYSWSKINDIFRYGRGWYKDFYLSLEEIDEVPDRRSGQANGVQVDIYDKYGAFIETLNSVKEVKEKYNIPAAKIKNIQQGNRYFEDHIFKYHSK